MHSRSVFLGVDFQSSTTCCSSPQRGNKRSYCAFALRALCRNKNNNKKRNHPARCAVSPVRLQSGCPGAMHGRNRVVRVSGWSGQMAGVSAATLNILFDFDSYFPPSSSSRTSETSPHSESVPTEMVLRLGAGGGGERGRGGGQRSCKQDSFFFNIKARSRRGYF